MTLIEQMLRYLSSSDAHKPLAEAGESYEIQDLLSLTQMEQPPAPSSDQTIADTWHIRRMALAGLWALGRAVEEPPDKMVDVNASGLLLANVWYAIAKDSQPSSRAKTDSLLRAALSSKLAGMPALSRALADSISLPQFQSSGFEEAFVALLQRRIVRCKRIALQNLHLLSQARRRNADVEYQPWWQGESLCFRGFSLFADVVSRGEQQVLESALDSVDRGHRILEDAGFVQPANYSSAMAQAMRSIWNCSTWKCLEVECAASPIWKRYVSLLARGRLNDRDARGILELWSSQQEAVRRGLLGEGDIVVRVPTGAGKTLAAELAIVAGFAKEPDTKCLFIAPFRALADEVLDSLTVHLEPLGYHVAQDLGPQEYPSPLGGVPSRDTDVLVTTPERARMLFSIDPGFFQRISTVVLDELHLATEGNDERGALYEVLIARLTRKCVNARFIGLSAILSEHTLGDMSAWLSNKHSNPGVVASSAWRPTQSEVLECVWPEGSSTGTLKLWQGRADVVARTSPVTLGSIHEPSTPATRLGSKSVAFPASKADVCALLVETFAKKGPVLVYCPQKKDVESVARSLETLLSSSGARLVDSLTRVAGPSDDLRMSLREWRGNDSPETRWLDMGFATHHAGLPQPLRVVLEDYFRNDRLRCLIATATLGAGVNLPVDTVVFHSTHRFEKSSRKMNRIRPEEFWNAAGRAGRPGRLEPGRVVYVSMKSRDRSDLLFFLHNHDDTASPLKSQLFRALTTSDFHQVSNALDLETIAILADPIDSQQPVTALADLWKSTLAHVEATESRIDPEPILALMNRMENHLATTNVTQRTATTWSQTGLSAESCARLDEASREPGIQEILTSEEHRSVDSILHATLPQCLDIPECKTAAEDRELALATALDWVSGATITDLLDNATRGFDAETKSLLTLIHDVLQYRLPWVLSGFLTICAQNLDIPLNSLPESLAYLPSMVKLGLPSPNCCHLASAGIGSRRLILALEAAHAADKSSSYTDIVEWLASTVGHKSALEVGLSARDWQGLGQHCSPSQTRTLRLAPGKSDYLPWPLVVDVGRETGTALRRRLLRPGSVFRLRHVYGTVERPDKVELMYEGAMFGRVPRPVANLVALDLDIGEAVEATCTSITSSAEGLISRVSVLLRRPSTEPL